MLALRFFGQPSANWNGTPLPAPERRAVWRLLALLVLDGERPTARTAAAAALWPDADPAKASQNLRICLYHLQRWLPPTDSAWLTAAGGELRWNADAPFTLDLHNIAAVADEVDDSATGLLASPLRHRAVEALREARGELLSPFDDGWLDTHRAIADDARRRLAERLAADASLRGDSRTAIAMALRRVELEPGAEPPRVRLIRTLAVSGDRLAALDAYRELERMLDDEYGATPGADAIELHEAVLAGRSDAYAEVALPPSQSVAADALTMIPVRASVFVGRSQELDELARLLTAERALVTIVGPGGIGKTRLAIELLRNERQRFAERRAFIDLSGIELAQQVVPIAASILKVDNPMGRRWVDCFSNAFAGQTLLVVIDNCEHVLQASVELVRIMREASPSTAIVCTSREPLGVDGELVWPIESLAADASSLGGPPHVVEGPAVTLFREHMNRIVGGGDPLSPVPNGTTIAAICLALDGLPLAIEVVAGLTAHLSLDEIRDRLAELAPHAVSGHRSRPERQRTLFETIAWSYRMLAEHERAAFRRLSVYVGGFSLAGAKSILGTSGDLDVPVSRALSTLVVKSLLVLSVDAHGRARYGMLRTIREYAQSRLAEDDFPAVWRLAHALRFDRLAESARTKLANSEEGPWISRLTREHDNVMAAIDFSVTHDRSALALRIVGHLWRYWQLRGLVRETRELAERLLRESGERSSPSDRAWCELTVGVLAFAQGDIEASDAALLLCAPVLSATEDPQIDLAIRSFLCGNMANAGRYNEAIVLGNDLLSEARRTANLGAEASGQFLVADIEARRGRFAEAERRYRAGLALGRRLSDRRLIARGHFGLGTAVLRRADVRSARHHLELALTIKRQLHDERGMAPLLAAAGDAASLSGDRALAENRYLQSLELYERQGNHAGADAVRFNLADMTWNAGDIEGARIAFETLLGSVSQMAHFRSWVEFRLADVCLADGDIAAARALAVRSHDGAVALGQHDVAADSLRVQALVELADGHIGQSIAIISAALAIWERLGGTDGMLRSLEAWCLIASANGEHTRALKVVGAADAARGALGARRPVPEERGIARVLTSARSALGALAAGRERAAGRRLTLPEAAAGALDGVAVSAAQSRAIS